MGAMLQRLKKNGRRATLALAAAGLFGALAGCSRG